MLVCACVKKGRVVQVLEVQMGGGLVYAGVRNISASMALTVKQTLVVCIVFFNQKHS